MGKRVKKAVKKIIKKERDFRVNNLNLFNKKGFPNKKEEDWKKELNL